MLRRSLLSRSELARDAAPERRLDLASEQTIASKLAPAHGNYTARTRSRPSRAPLEPNPLFYQERTTLDQPHAAEKDQSNQDRCHIAHQRPPQRIAAARQVGELFTATLLEQDPAGK